MSRTWGEVALDTAVQVNALTHSFFRGYVELPVDALNVAGWLSSYFRDEQHNPVLIQQPRIVRDFQQWSRDEQDKERHLFLSEKGKVQTQKLGEFVGEASEFSGDAFVAYSAGSHDLLQGVVGLPVNALNFVVMTTPLMSALSQYASIKQHGVTGFEPFRPAFQQPQFVRDSQEWFRSLHETTTGSFQSEQGRRQAEGYDKVSGFLETGKFFIENPRYMLMKVVEQLPSMAVEGGLGRIGAMKGWIGKLGEAAKTILPAAIAGSKEEGDLARDLKQRVEAGEMSQQEANLRGLGSFGVNIVIDSIPIGSSLSDFVSKRGKPPAVGKAADMAKSFFVENPIKDRIKKEVKELLLGKESKTTSPDHDSNRSGLSALDTTVAPDGVATQAQQNSETDKHARTVSGLTGGPTQSVVHAAGRRATGVQVPVNPSDPQPAASVSTSDRQATTPPQKSTEQRKHQVKMAEAFKRNPAKAVEIFPELVGAKQSLDAVEARTGRMSRPGQVKLMNSLKNRMAHQIEHGKPIPSPEQLLKVAKNIVNQSQGHGY